ncbi:MAG TPA: hypothetical protein VJJ52_06255 [Candidatus Nanoarchaeia archaeon]|nr:hypothetical protein [Candidatus Nanoarchaeia archaeon]
MKKSNAAIYFTLLVLLMSCASAATIYGTVYDLDLKKINNAIVDINTIPKQSVVAKNGTYSFNVPNGNYLIEAKLMRNGAVTDSVQENITVKQEGSYVLDLIMFPNLEEGVEDFNVNLSSELIDNAQNKTDTGYLYLLIIIIVSLTIIFSIIYFLRIKQEKIAKNEEKKTEVAEESNELDQVIKIIKQEGGRATQKDIRKQIPLSEAKISLMIAELEHKGLVEKIKKGRGNIIILKKK